MRPQPVVLEKDLSGALIVPDVEFNEGSNFTPATEGLIRVMGSSALLTPPLNVPVTQKIWRTLTPEQGSAWFLQSGAAFSTSLSRFELGLKCHIFMMAGFLLPK